MSTLSNVTTRQGEANPPCVRLAPDTIPEAIGSQTGVSVSYVLCRMKRVLVFLALFISFLFCCGQARAQQENVPNRQLELFCGLTFGYADTNWLRLYDVQLNATPGLRWNLGKDWSIAAQGIIPVVSVGYTYSDISNKYWRLNMATVSRQLHFNNKNQHLRISAGLFGRERYGVDVRWAWPVNSWLLLNAQAGVSSPWVLGVDLKGNGEAKFYSDYKVSGTVGADVYLQSLDVEFRLSGGRYINGDYGSQIDVMRHFRHVTLLAYAQLRLGKLESNPFDNQKYRTNGGFKIIWMIPPYKKSSRKVVVRPASNFVLSHSSRAGGESMRSYSIDPEENSRERLIDVDWGLGKEESR